MTSKETPDTNSKRADEDAPGRTSEKLPFEMPECCRQMMTQIMGSFCDHAEGGEERPAQNGSNSPGILGRLMLRMMKACCGRFAAKQNSAV